jgi:hypothetical protein
MLGYIVWHNDNSNETQLWVLNGGAIARRHTVQDERGQPIFVGPPWRTVGSIDGNIIWHNDTSNETQIWVVGGDNKIKSRLTVQDEKGQPIFVGPPWRIVGAAVLDNSLPEHTSIVWHNDTSNETQIWILDDNGQRITDRLTVQDEKGQPIFVGPPWRIVGAYLGRIVWHNDTSNETQIWEVFPQVPAQGNTIRIKRRVTVQDEKGQPIFVGPPWRVVGVADFNADALHHPQTGDIVWHNDTSNETQIWILDDDGQKIAIRVTVTDENHQPIFVGPPWHIVATADRLDF